MLHVPLDLHWNQRTTLQRNQKREKGNKHNNKHNDNQNDCFGTKMHHNRNRDWLNDSRQSPSRKRPLPASANQSWKKPCSSAFSRLSVAPGRWCVSFSSDLVQMIFYAWYTTQRKKLTSSFLLFLPPRGVYSLSPWYKLVRYIMISFLSGWSTSISCFKRKLHY